MSNESRTRYRLVIDTENAAFGRNPGERAFEVARILREEADRAETAGLLQKRALFDFNGNSVGQMRRSDESILAHTSDETLASDLRQIAAELADSKDAEVLRAAAERLGG